MGVHFLGRPFTVYFRKGGERHSVFYKRMPRPKSGDVYERELRITPPDGQPIFNWLVNADDFVKLIAAEEGGGDTGKKLHYHLYVETTRSESWLKKWVYTVARCINGEKGNAVYFSRKPHDRSIGYVVKNNKIVCRHGVDQMFITEWLAKSDEYVKNKSTERKREQRTKQSIYKEMIDAVEKEIQDGHYQPTLDLISSALIRKYSSRGMYPNRNQHELFVIKLLHPYNESFVEQYYTRGLSRGVW